jgi:ferredoxin-NADP reductase
VNLARALAERIDTLRRDLTMIRRSFAGRSAPPVRITPRAATESVLAPRVLRVAQIVRETKDAVSIVLEDPSGAPIAFRPGQFFTVLVSIGGETLRRAYSASSDARDTTRVAITVKRVAGGRVSTHLNDALREGDSLRVLGPSGSFVLPELTAASRHLVLIGGGSGITPLMAILRVALATEARTIVSLLYANRSPDDEIFARAIDALAAAHSERFTVRRHFGLVDAEIAAREIALLDERLDLPTDFFVCGPEPMRAIVREVLAARGIDAARIHEERFASPGSRAVAAPSGDAQTLTIRTKSGERRVLVGSGQTLLEAGLAGGVDMPFSCAMGGCGACKVRLREGEATMDEPSCLTSEERDEGFVLACASRPNGPCVVELP